MMNQKAAVPKKILVLGSGGLRIGQAGEFDYSGSQALKALREEGIRTVLVNPNIATVQTDESMADVLYLEPLTIDRVSEIIRKERPDGLLLGFGGQTALNLGLALEEQGILNTYGITVYGTPISTVRITEDRELFKKTLDEIGVQSPKSRAASNVKEALLAACDIGFPVMIRSGFALGGQGSGVCTTPELLAVAAAEALNASPQLLIEEYLGGWKEIEYEVVRDYAGNTVTVCNMENMDPLGIHTGESIVVAPSQTLNDREYHLLRLIACRVANHVGIIGECNIQFALHPRTGEYRVIEMNARLSRSSALASKATGYPLAFIAAKLALHARLDELENKITKTTSAFFEPALDYVVVKIPRWDTEKLKIANRTIGTEMKSVGEVMAIGRSFPEALQKAARMLKSGVSDLACPPIPITGNEDEIAQPTDFRLFCLYRYFQEGGSVERAHALTDIDQWFLHEIRQIADFEAVLRAHSGDIGILTLAKKLGFSDKRIAQLWEKNEESVRARRIKANIIPVVKQIDTLAGEFPATTNYLYLTYHGDRNDIASANQDSIVVLGSGPYAIGSSVEFDWCAVNTVRALRAHNRYSILINSNPETVSTDYDESDRLYFEEITEERVRDILDFEHPRGVILSVGGQGANNLAIPLFKKRYPILGTSPHSIDRAEDRGKFSQLLNSLGIDQPRWVRVTTLQKAVAFARDVGYPLLIRPSYVLSGAAMNVAYNDEELSVYCKEAQRQSGSHSVVLSEFIQGAKELEIDGVARTGVIIAQAMTEHIEQAGVHSGDATIILPPQNIYLATVKRAKEITAAIVSALRISGPFNIQFIARENKLQVIECNVRASRSFPFVSKITHVNFIELATAILMEWEIPAAFFATLELPYVGVKAPQFSYRRLKGADPVGTVEMASTGEVAIIGENLEQAFLRAWQASDNIIKSKSLFVSVGGIYTKAKLLEPIRALEKLGWEIYATEGTHAYLTKRGIGCYFVYKPHDALSPSLIDLVSDGKIGVMVTIPGRVSHSRLTNGYVMRRMAVDHGIPLVTNAQVARLLLQCISHLDGHAIPVVSWQEYIARLPSLL